MFESGMRQLVKWTLIILTVAVPVVIIAYVVTIYTSSPGSSDLSRPTGPRAVSSLRFAVVVSNQGNKGPNYTLANFNYIWTNKTYWPYGKGMLTKQGRVQMYNLGAQIRYLYMGFTSPAYFPSRFYASSITPLNILKSAAVFLAGMYPPKDFQLWNDNILWQPVPIQLDSQDKSKFAQDECPRYAEIAVDLQTTFDELHFVNITTVNNYVSSKLQATVLRKSEGLISIWDSFRSIESEGYTLPDWASGVFPDPIKPLVDEYYRNQFAYNDSVIKMVIGPFYKNLLEVLSNRTGSEDDNNDDDYRMYYYSGDSGTLTALQAVLGVPSSRVVATVPPGSALIFELHQNATSSDYYLEVLFIDGSDPNLEPVSITTPACGEPCEFSLLLENTRRFFNYTSYDVLCESTVAVGR